MALSFSRHAHQRMQERFGITLSDEELAQVCATLQNAIGEQRDGAAECVAAVRRGLIRFVAVIDCRTRKVLTVYPEAPKPMELTRRQARKRRKAVNRCLRAYRLESTPTKIE